MTDRWGLLFTREYILGRYRESFPDLNDNTLVTLATIARLHAQAVNMPGERDISLQRAVDGYMELIAKGHAVVIHDPVENRYGVQLTDKGRQMVHEVRAVGLEIGEPKGSA